MSAAATVTPQGLAGAAAGAADPGFGLYVHWPFCKAKCPYCDFNSHVRESVDHPRWRRALLDEMAHYASLTPGRRLTSIFFGGGTPSLMHPETVAAVIEAASGHWTPTGDIEITLEANPTSVEAEKFAAFRAAGVNRLSLGVQALDDDALAFLGRQHSAAEARAAIDLARHHFPRFSFDLIYARPGQTAGQWREELSRALAEEPGHLSVYQLTIEENTPFHARWRQGELVPPGEETAGTLWETTQEMLGSAGLDAYEVSNHAVPGEASRHNLTYWRYGDYVGIGPGAHGRLTLDGRKRATRQHRAPEAWLETVERDGHATRTDAAIATDERLAEMVMMGLRLDEGIARAAFRRELDAEPEDLLDRARLTALAEAGYLSVDDAKVAATAAGRVRLNAVTGYLLG